MKNKLSKKNVMKLLVILYEQKIKTEQNKTKTPPTTILNIFIQNQLSIPDKNNYLASPGQGLTTTGVLC